MKIQYTPIAPGDDRDPDQVNAIYDAIEAGSLVTADNLREEGFHADAFVPYVQGEIVAIVNPGGRAAASLPTTGVVWTVLSHNGTPMQDGPIALDAGDLLFIRSRVFFQNTFSNGIGLTPGSRFEGRLVYNGAQVLAHSLRPRLVLAAISDKRHGCFETVGYIAGPASINSVALQYRLDAGVAFPWAPLLTAKRYRRVS